MHYYNVCLSCSTNMLYGFIPCCVLVKSDYMCPNTRVRFIGWYSYRQLLTITDNV